MRRTVVKLIKIQLLYCGGNVGETEEVGGVNLSGETPTNTDIKGVSTSTYSYWQNCQFLTQSSEATY